MKLHLGCGQRYLDGYVNIDFPLSGHSVQQKSVADLQADILLLHYPINSINEIRLHHVFEHFPRPIACALLAGWYSWLIPGGLLHIEVPDFQQTARVIMNPFASFARKAVAERHLYGSHEASWAVHREGYTSDMLTRMIENFGFIRKNIRKNRWKGTYNFELFAVSDTCNVTHQDWQHRAEVLLSQFLVDNEESEKHMLKVWLEIFTQQLDRMVATDA